MTLKLDYKIVLLLVVNSTILNFEIPIADVLFVRPRSTDAGKYKRSQAYT